MRGLCLERTIRKPWAWPATAVLAWSSVCAVSPAQGPVDWMKERDWWGGFTSMAYDSARERLVLFGSEGGWDPAISNRALTNETWEWDGVRWLERSPANRPSGRMVGAMAYDTARGEVVLFAGTSFATPTLNDTWTWNGIDWTLEQITTPPTPRFPGAMVYDAGRREIVMFGGSTGSPPVPLSETWIWNGSTWKQRFPLTTVPPGRWGQGVAFDAAQGEVVMFGGDSGTGLLSDTWTWNGVDWTRHSPTPAPSKRGFPGMAYDARRQQAVLFGGAVSGSVYLDDTWLWDGASRTWKMASPTTRPSARYLCSMAYDASRQRVVMRGGGKWRGFSLPRETWAWDGTDWAVVAAPTVPPPRSRHALAEDPAQQQLVLFGGSDTATQFGDTWTFDGFAWTQSAPPVSPPALSFHAMATDAAGQGTVLFGGLATPGGIRADTWTWNAGTWTQQSPSPSPPLRYLHAMAHDPSRQRTVLFGGQNPWGFLGDTWEWDGTAWLLVATTGPTARRSHAMAYDAVSRTVLLFGGQDLNAILGDTWSWNGTAWSQVVTPGPSARYQHTMACDRSRNHTVLFGGRDSRGHLSDAWEWNGSVWTQFRLPATPLPRSLHAMAYDAPRSRIAVFGGQSNLSRSEGHLGDTWFLGAHDPAATTPYGTGCAGTPGDVPLVGSGVPYVGNPRLTLDVVSPRPNAPCWFGIGLAPANIPLPGGCTLLIQFPTTIPILLPAATNAGGYGQVGFSVPRDLAMIGVSVYAQAFVADPVGPTFGLAFTGGLQVVIGE